MPQRPFYTVQLDHSPRCGRAGISKADQGSTQKAHTCWRERSEPRGDVLDCTHDDPNSRDLTLGQTPPPWTKSPGISQRELVQNYMLYVLGIDWVYGLHRVLSF